jgi:hypothetical protein
VKDGRRAAHLTRPELNAMLRTFPVIRILLAAILAAGASPLPVLAGGDLRGEGGSAQAEAHDCPPCDKEHLLRLAPPDCEAVIVINNGARQRRSGGGRAVERMLSDIDALPETSAAWAELARALDWPVEKAFDELLGRRVTLVMRGLDDPSRTQWVVMSEVSAATERRLRERLRPAPRRHHSGLIALAIEHGRYELVLGPTGAAQTLAQPSSARTDEGGTMILLGPGGDNRLMAELAPMLLRSMPPSPSGPDGRECDFVVVLRHGHARAPSTELDVPIDSGRFLLLAGTLEETGWDISLAASPGMVWDRPQGGGEIRPWSDAAFRALESDALLAIMGTIGSTPLEGLSAVHALSGLLPVIPFTLQGEPFGQRAALFIREHVGSRASRSASPDSPLMYRAIAPGTAHPERQLPGEGLLSVGLAIEATDTRRMMLEGDQMMARLMGFLESGDVPVNQGPRVQLVVTVPDDEIRSLSLDGTFPINAALAGGIERAFGESPKVTWGVRALPGTRRGGEQPGWWVGALSPARTPTVADDAAVLVARDTAGRMLPRLSVGVVRPSALQRAVNRLDPEFLTPLRAMRWIDTLRWDAWQRSDGTVEATIRIRMQSGL